MTALDALRDRLALSLLRLAARITTNDRIAECVADLIGLLANTKDKLQWIIDSGDIVYVDLRTARLDDDIHGELPF